MDKKLKKITAGCCHFCKTDDYCVLDVHRIIEGANGGKYEDHNVVCTCACCHRKIHAGHIVIDKWYYSTGGKVLHYFVEGKEHYS